MKLASRMAKIKPSPTLAITAKAQALRAQGRNIIGFGAGEPDFDTPDNIKAAAVDAIRRGFTKYTPVGGTDELKDAIRAKLKRDNGLEYDRSEIVVSCGAKHTLFNLLQVLFEEGDEVLIPSPCWVSYPDMVLLSGATPVILETKESEGFKADPGLLRSKIGAKTRAIILNSPSNPTGAAYTREELSALASVILEGKIIVISDDIYEKIVYDGFQFADIASVRPDLRPFTVVVNGVSKSYSMTGWRIGYAAGDREIISAVTGFQSQNTSNPTSISQAAAVEALNGDQSSLGIMVEEFRRRRDFMVEGLDGIPGMSCLRPQGAFYAFPNIAGLIGRSKGGRAIRGSGDLAEYLLDEVDVAVVPGLPFGSDSHIRLSYATSMANIQEGLKRIKHAISLLK
ncbi:MAG: pyridoxal phosphate-dependent aminotransferase [Syntrophales bacterium]|nr:pyridoxal phosphate-dependent aminotransferase [Syntrophales bacterium]MDD5233591.1 pyridoxal phosphate-dependent aminotransferase [Syntrophales bacterium]MDD5531700.1 pyridoxal phosphate-dependent aminotransferase [Syntrophales bacterium]